MMWVERDLKAHLSFIIKAHSNPLGRDTFHKIRLPRTLIQPGVECLQGWDIYSISMLPNLNLSSFSLKPLSLSYHYTPWRRVPLQLSCRPPLGTY